MKSLVRRSHVEWDTILIPLLTGVHGSHSGEQASTLTVLCSSLNVSARNPALVPGMRSNIATSKSFPPVVAAATIKSWFHILHNQEPQTSLYVPLKNMLPAVVKRTARGWSWAHAPEHSSRAALSNLLPYAVLAAKNTAFLPRAGL